MIIWALRGILRDNIQELNFDSNSTINNKTYKKLHDEFQKYYWDSIKMNPQDVNKELDKLWNERNKKIDSKKLYDYFIEQLNSMEKQLKEIINGDLF